MPWFFSKRSLLFAKPCNFSISVLFKFHQVCKRHTKRKEERNYEERNHNPAVGPIGIHLPRSGLRQ